MSTPLLSSPLYLFDKLTDDSSLKCEKMTQLARYEPLEFGCFSSSISKLNSGCSSWNNLNALPTGINFVVVPSIIS